MKVIYAYLQISKGPKYFSFLINISFGISKYIKRLKHDVYVVNISELNAFPTKNMPALQRSMVNVLWRNIYVYSKNHNQLTSCS
jgi:hypothetical protein